MKSFQWMLASLFTGLLVAGCAVSNGPDESADDESVSEPTAEPQSGSITETFYYSDATWTTEVGHCQVRTCVPKHIGCTGIKTAFKEVYTDPCY